MKFFNWNWANWLNRNTFMPQVILCFYCKTWKYWYIIYSPPVVIMWNSNIFLLNYQWRGEKAKKFSLVKKLWWKYFLKPQLQRVHNLHHNYSTVKELTQVHCCIFKATHGRDPHRKGPEPTLTHIKVFFPYLELLVINVCPWKQPKRDRYAFFKTKRNSSWYHSEVFQTSVV